MLIAAWILSAYQKALRETWLDWIQGEAVVHGPREAPAPLLMACVKSTTLILCFMNCALPFLPWCTLTCPCKLPETKRLKKILKSQPFFFSDVPWRCFKVVGEGTCLNVMIWVFMFCSHSLRWNAHFIKVMEGCCSICSPHECKVGFASLKTSSEIWMLNYKALVRAELGR